MKTWEAYNRRSRTKMLISRNAFHAVRIYGVDKTDLADILREVAEEIEMEINREEADKQ